MTAPTPIRRTLQERVARLGPPPMEVSLRILREAAVGVAAAHRAGRSHHGLGPETILLLEEPDGFDLVGVEVLDPAPGPPPAGYAAPELPRGVGAGPRADVYSLGAIGYSLLAGDLSPAGADGSASGAAVPLRERNPEVPAEVARVVERALAPDPVDRWADAGELADALAALEVDTGAGPGDRAPEPPPGDRKYRARRHPRLPDEAATAVPPDSPARPTAGGVVRVILLLVLLALALWWVAG